MFRFNFFFKCLALPRQCHKSILHVFWGKKGAKPKFRYFSLLDIFMTAHKIGVDFFAGNSQNRQKYIILFLSAINGRKPKMSTKLWSYRKNQSPQDGHNRLKIAHRQANNLIWKFAIFMSIMFLLLENHKKRSKTDFCTLLRKKRSKIKIQNIFVDLGYFRFTPNMSLFRH